MSMGDGTTNSPKSNDSFQCLYGAIGIVVFSIMIRVFASFKFIWCDWEKWQLDLSLPKGVSIQYGAMGANKSQKATSWQRVSFSMVRLGDPR